MEFGFDLGTRKELPLSKQNGSAKEDAPKGTSKIPTLVPPKIPKRPNHEVDDPAPHPSPTKKAFTTKDTLGESDEYDDEHFNLDLNSTPLPDVLPEEEEGGGAWTKVERKTKKGGGRDGKSYNDRGPKESSLTYALPSIRDEQRKGESDYIGRQRCSLKVPGESPWTRHEHARPR
jgi:hypothetical protein